MRKKKIEQFRTMIWDFYRTYGRQFPWRQSDNPYHIVVSELMLQQTQTFRVEPKYEQFITALPDFQTLAQTSLHTILSLWQGLGYNRRAKMLQQLAQRVVDEHNGALPANPAILETFPGIGKTTAASICAFAFNIPTIFIETNIRTVFITHFFQQEKLVNDRAIMPLVTQTIDQDNPREWYYALMDYGVFLKKEVKNQIQRSLHYRKQSPFQGSDRQIRGRILKLLLTTPKISLAQIITTIGDNPERVKGIVKQLCKEGLLCKKKNLFSIG